MTIVMMMMMMPPTNNLGNALHRGMPGIRRFTNSCCTNFHWHDDDDDDADDNKLFSHHLPIALKVKKIQANLALSLII